MPLPLLAIPVIHSSGLWIASTGGYMASTMSTTWIGAFVAGNMSTLASLGVVSGASIFGAGVATGSTALGAALANVGLGGLASSLGLVPATFLGLTMPVWAGVGIGVTGATAIYASFNMSKLNEERRNGGLENITIMELVKAVKAFETESLKLLCEKLSTQVSGISFNSADETLAFDEVEYEMGDISYRFNKDGSEELLLSGGRFKKKTVIRVKEASEVEDKEDKIPEDSNDK